jgi:salicylate hydroxylase
MVLGSTVLNIVLSHPDDIDTSGWSGDQIAQQITKQFEDWSPAVKKLIALMRPNPANWPVYAVDNLPRWTSESGKFVLMGDASHSMAFYMSSGVSMAVEDAAALAECVACGDRLPLSRSMKIFEQHRIERTSAVAEASLRAGNALHLPDGPEQEARDALLRLDESGETTADNPCGLISPETRDWVYSYDTKKVMRRLLDEVM